MVHRDVGRDGEQAASLLRQYRRAAGLSQRQLADAADVSIGVVRDLEQGRTGRLTARSAEAFVMALGLSADRAEMFAFATRRTPRFAHTDRPARVRLAVLGPLVAWRDDAAVELGPPSQRAVLGLLALSPGEHVRRESLIDAWWGEHPPPSAVNQVQARVSRLRRILNPGRSARDQDGILASAGTGYRLSVTAGQLDLLAFRDLASRADAARLTGETVAACRHYLSALDLWRGDPLADIDALRQHPAVIGLSQQRWAVTVSYAQSACELGWYDRVLQVVWPLAQREPLHETAHAVLMIALAGTGRQAAALEVFEAMRRRLDEQLGVRPGRELVHAHLRVLRAELPAPSVASASTALQARRSLSGKAARRTAVPRQLPAANPRFVGRAAELAVLTGLLDLLPRDSGTTQVCAIGGTAGVGKTALAVYWAHQVSDQFPDGQLYVDLRGFDASGSPVRPHDALHGFLEALGVPSARVPARQDARAGLYRTLLSGRRVLVLLDNAHSAEQVRPLLPAGRGCMVVITGRSQLSALVVTHAAQLICLDVLSAGEAHDLLALRLGADRVAHEPDAVRRLTDLTARLPLALSIIAARAAAHPRHPLAALATERHESRARLQEFDGGEPSADVRAAFSWSYRQLSEPAARMFRFLGIHPGPDISIPAAASLAGVTVPAARGALAELSRAGLLVEHVPGRYRCHDLLRIYAGEQTRLRDARVERHDALLRALGHYLHTARAAEKLLDPARSPLVMTEIQRGTIRERLDSDAQALAWFTAEHQVLLALLRRATGFRLDAYVLYLASTLVTFLDRQGHLADLIASQRMALAAALRLGHLAGQASAHRDLAHAYAMAHRYDRARRHMARALALYRELGDWGGEPRAQLSRLPAAAVAVLEGCEPGVRRG